MTKVQLLYVHRADSGSKRQVVKALMINFRVCKLALKITVGHSYQ